MIISGEFFAYGLARVSRAWRKPGRRQIYVWLPCGNSCDTMGDNTEHGLISTENCIARRTSTEMPQLRRGLRKSCGVAIHLHLKCSYYIWKNNPKWMHFKLSFWPTLINLRSVIIWSKILSSIFTNDSNLVCSILSTENIFNLFP